MYDGAWKQLDPGPMLRGKQDGGIGPKPSFPAGARDNSDPDYGAVCTPTGAFGFSSEIDRAMFFGPDCGGAEGRSVTPSTAKASGGPVRFTLAPGLYIFVRYFLRPIFSVRDGVQAAPKRSIRVTGLRPNRKQ